MLSHTYPARHRPASVCMPARKVPQDPLTPVLSSEEATA